MQVLQWGADIACSSIFLETVRDSENNVIGYRAWIPLDSIAVIEYQRVVTDSLAASGGEDGSAPLLKRTKRMSAESLCPSSPGSVVSLKQIGDTLQNMYSHVSFGPSGTLSLDLEAPNSLFKLLSAEQVFANNHVDVSHFQSNLENYVEDNKFICPPVLLKKGDIRSLRFGFKGGQGINSAEHLRTKWARPERRPPKKVIVAHLNGLLRGSGDFKTDVTLMDFRDLMPSEFPSSSVRPPFQGPVFKSPLAFYAPIALPTNETESDQKTKGKMVVLVCCTHSACC